MQSSERAAGHHGFRGGAAVQGSPDAYGRLPRPHPDLPSTPHCFSTPPAHQQHAPAPHPADAASAAAHAPATAPATAAATTTTATTTTTFTAGMHLQNKNLKQKII